MECSNSHLPECGPWQPTDLTWESCDYASGGGGGPVDPPPDPIIIAPDTCCVVCDGEVVTAYATSVGWATVNESGLTVLDCTVEVLDPCDPRCAPVACPPPPMTDRCCDCSCGDSDRSWLIEQMMVGG